MEHVFHSPKELLKLSIPSVVYAVQNNMAFLALSNLDAAVYQVRTTTFGNHLVMAVGTLGLITDRAGQNTSFQALPLILHVLQKVLK